MDSFQLNRSRAAASLLRSFLLTGVLASCCCAGAASFTAALDRAVVETGDAATLTLRLVGATPKGDPKMPLVKNLQIAGRGAGQQVVIINNQVQSSYVYTYSVVPGQPGDYLIPAIELEADDGKVSSTPLSLKALPSVIPASIRLQLPRKEIYLGERMVVEVQLRVGPGVRDLDRLDFGSWEIEGFTAGKFIQGEVSQIRESNQVINLIPFRIPLTAAKAGTVTVPPLQAGMTLYLGVDIWGRPAKPRQVKIATTPGQITVLPLPTADVPPTFSGAVGVFTLASSIDRTNLSVGDPITLSLHIGGEGALDTMVLPEQPEWNEFKTYPPVRKTESADPFGVKGTNHFELVVSPQNSGIKELPPFSFSFFNPREKRYRTLTRPVTPLLVRAGTSTPQPALPENKEREQRRDEIVHIKSSLATATSIPGTLLRQPWFLGLQALPVIAWIAASIVENRRRRWAADPRLRRRHEVKRRVTAGLAELETLANDSDRFFATLFHLLQEQLGEVLDRPASGITEAVIDEELAAGVDAETRALLHELFQACNLARYAPARSSEELTQLIPKIRRATQALQKFSQERRS